MNSNSILPLLPLQWHIPSWLSVLCGGTDKALFPPGRGTPSGPGAEKGRSPLARPTNEIYCFREVGADVGRVAVFHGDPLVVEVGGAGLRGPP